MCPEKKSMKLIRGKADLQWSFVIEFMPRKWRNKNRMLKGKSVVFLSRWTAIETSCGESAKRNRIYFIRDDPFPVFFFFFF